MVFALLPFCPFALLSLCPFAQLPLPLPCSLVQLSLGGYQMKEFFVLVFIFQFMCRYCRLSWCYSCRHRWQLWPSSLGVKQRLCPFWLQMLKLYTKHLKSGRGARSWCRSSWDLRIWIAKPKIACFDIQVSNEPNAALAQIVGKSGGDMGFC